MAYLKYHVLL